MSGHGEKLTRKQEQAIACLLAEPTVTAAANRCGVGEATLRRWLRDPQFQSAYRAARRSVLDVAIASLHQAGTDAVAALRRAVNSGQPGVEVRAAGIILDHVLGTLDRMDVEERLQRLELLPQVRNATKQA